jgi:ATP-dependent HslUV protease subunit HslV
MNNTELSAKEIALKALKIAGEICIYTNSEIILEEI